MINERCLAQVAGAKSMDLASLGRTVINKVDRMKRLGACSVHLLLVQFARKEKALKKERFRAKEL